MTTRDVAWPAGTPCWVDLAVPDVPSALDFYSSVLGWSYQDTGSDFGNYQMAQVKGRLAAGIGPVMGEGQPAQWTLYLASDDADVTAQAIAAHGGQIVMPAMDVAGTGRMLIATDASGGPFGVWQAGTTIGTEIVNEPGCLVWEDCRLTDVQAGRDFYRDVFGFTYQDIPGGPADYSTFQLGGDPLGGLGAMMGESVETGSHWLSYFSVADVDAALVAVAAGGGTVTRPAEDTPYGRMASLEDPFGARFALITVPAG